MCGRYMLRSPDWVESDFPETFATLAAPLRRPRYNIAPGQMVLAAVEGPRGRVLEQMRWGIDAPWKGNQSRVINARSERLRSSRFWGPIFESGRCALPADGFFEWRPADGQSGRRRPYLFEPEDGQGFWLAGLCAPQGEEDSQRASVIVTVEANELVAGVHDRMPAMLRGEDLASWLGGDSDAALSTLIPFPSKELSALEIAPAIGNASLEGAELIKPARDDGPVQPRLF